MSILKKVRGTFVVSHELEVVEMGNEPLRTHEETEECEASASTSDLEIGENIDSQSQWKGFIHMLKKGPKRFQNTLNPLTLTKLSRRKSRSARDNMIPMIPVFDHGMCCFKPSWKNFSLEELHAATNNFSRETIIGEGGYAQVYKGTLPDGSLVAIKRLMKGDIEEMAADFLSELGIIVHVNHPNIAHVIGYGVEGGLHLISDFGLAKWLPEQWTHHTVSSIEGTFGYLPPEFFMHGIVDEKTDVYAYGVVLLELITGRLALDSLQHSLVMWSKPLIEKNKLKELIDPVLGDTYDLNQMKLMILTASMRHALEILKGEKNYEEMLKKTKWPSLRRTYSLELQDAEEYNSTKYLSDVDQLMQIALEI
ncbi:hypothetical protein V2J09_013418 [Rumex salicifolius]